MQKSVITNSPTVVPFVVLHHLSICADSRLLFGDFMQTDVESRVYEEIADIPKCVRACEEYLDDYNAMSQTPMKLTLFVDAVEHVARISRCV